jgi:hypothetical protein
MFEQGAQMHHPSVQPDYRQGQLGNEAAALARRLGFLGPAWPRAWIIHLMVIAVFGVLLPYIKGLDFFDPAIVGLYTCLGSIFAAPAAAASLEAASLAVACARVAVCVVYGELMALAMTATGVATVYFSHRRGLFFPPALDSLLESSALGFVLSCALCAVAVWVSVRWSSGIAKLLLRLIFLGILVWIFLRGRIPLLGFVSQNPL